MHSVSTHRFAFARPLVRVGALAACFVAAQVATAAPPVVDDFSDEERTGTGATRIVVDDREVGGQSRATTEYTNGTLKVQGQLHPARGMPGWVSIVLPLSPEMAPQDLSEHEGIRIRVKITQGSLAVQAASTEVDNFDYHISTPLARQPGELQEVRIPFKNMKRSWSEPTPLNLKTISSINLVAAGLGREPFGFEVDEVGFY